MSRETESLGDGTTNTCRARGTHTLLIHLPTAEAVGYLVPSRLAGLVDSGSGIIANNALFNPSCEAEYESKCHEP